MFDLFHKRLNGGVILYSYEYFIEKKCSYFIEKCNMFLRKFSILQVKEVKHTSYYNPNIYKYLLNIKIYIKLFKECVMCILFTNFM